MSREAPSNDWFSRINRILASLVWITALVILAITGYWLVTTIINTRASVVDAPQTLVAGAQQVIHPTPTITVDPLTIVRQVRSLSRLETVSFTIEKVITAESGEGPLGFLFQDRLLLVARGEVIAGVDLSKLSDQDVKVAGTSIFITLPAAEIFVATLDNRHTYVYDRQTGLIGQQRDLETQARQKAQEAIRQVALEDGVLSMAQDNAEQVIRKFLGALNFADVTIIQGTPSPDKNHGGTPSP